MNYTIEEIYCLVGKDDKTAGLTFKYESESFNKYGSFITVLFIYNQYERPEMDKLIQNEKFCNNGRIKAKYLGADLSEDKINSLLNDGVLNTDILEILTLKDTPKNTFHSTDKRELNKINLKIQTQPKGQDFDWMYGFHKRQVNEGVGQSPNEKAFYLAGKLYYEAENLTELEKQEIYINGEIEIKVEWELLQMKFIREEISDAEKKRLAELYGNKKREDFQILDDYLKQAGSSLKKLSTDNIDQAVELYFKVNQFKERRLNVLGKYPIYIDIDSYLHIYMRHVEEFRVNSHFEHKDNFQWKEEDVFYVMGHIIKQIDKDYQDFRENNPNSRYSKYGKQSIYFEGDYYTFHIELNGRISTFHKNKKE